MKIAICEDEKIFGRFLREEIEKYFLKQKKGVTIEYYQTGNSLKESEYMDYELLFLDVDLQEKEDGITLARTLREQGYEGFIIFLTSHQEEAYKAFEVEAFRYLLKPVEKEVLEKALQDVLFQIEKKQTYRLCLKSGQTILQLRTEDILYIETFERKVKIHTEKKEYIVNEKIKELEVKIRDPYFFRIHKAFLVNFRYIQEHTDTSIVMMNGETLYISRLRLSAFKKAFMDYLLKG